MPALCENHPNLFSSNSLSILHEETPHFFTVNYNFRHRFSEETVDRVFAWILEEVAQAGYLSPTAVFVDGAHTKANANTKSSQKSRFRLRPNTMPRN